MAKDFYEILGLARGASKDDIRRAYRKLAQEHHPDKGTGEAQKFKEINEAYEVLSDETKRAQYDRFGQTFEQARSQGNTGFGGFGGFSENYSGGPFGGMEFDLGDIFSDMFGFNRRRGTTHEKRGVDLEYRLVITLEEAYKGTEKEIELNKFDVCERCRGSGAEPGKSVMTCPRCHGQGTIRTTQATIFGTVAVSHVCERCSGRGSVPEVACTRCSGTGRHKHIKTLRVKIPAGVDNGMRLRISGEGEAGYQGSAAGDLYLEISIEPHPKFGRTGDNIHSNVDISFLQAILGDKIGIDTLGGEVLLKIPPGTQPGTVFALKGKGMPRLSKMGHGDHLARVNVKIPTKLSRDEKKLLEQMQNLE